MQVKYDAPDRDQDDKIKQLKKRNTELAGITRRLEEKVKLLQGQSKRHSNAFLATVVRSQEDELASDASRKAADIEELQNMCEQMKEMLVNAGEVRAVEVRVCVCFLSGFALLTSTSY
jgi:predicted RNase H-like nuclease (RuvC/YqgF family)